MTIDWKKELYKYLFSYISNMKFFLFKSDEIIRMENLFIDLLEQKVDILVEVNPLNPLFNMGSNTQLFARIKLENNEILECKKKFHLDFSKPENIVYDFIEDEIVPTIKRQRKKLVSENSKSLKPSTADKRVITNIKSQNEIKEEKTKALNTDNAIKPLNREIPKESLILVCRVTKERYIDTREKLKKRSMKNFNDNFREFSKAIFGYWKGSPFKTPEDLKSNLKISSEDNIEDNNNFYYLVKFDNVSPLEELFDKAPSSREKALKQLAIEKDIFECSGLFSDLPSSCTIL